MAVNELPPGFVLDQPDTGLPPGFVLDKPEGSSLGGIAKSLGTGLAQGAIGLAGLPADLAHLYADKGDANPLGSEGLQKKVEQYTGDFYKPQGTAEDIASKVGQFAPALIGGPETLATKALTRVVAPAVASEAGGAIGGPLGEVAGALAGGAGASKVAQFKAAAKAASQAAKTVPTGEQLLKSGGDQFNAARDMNVVVKPDFTTAAAADMRDAIKSYDPELVKAVHGAADRLENLGVSGPGLPPTAVPMNEVENVRKQLVSLKTSNEPSIRSAAKEAIESLQASQKALNPSDVLSGDAGAYSHLIRNATGDWAAGKRSAAVTGKLDLASLNAGTAGVGANEDNNTRQALKQLARPMNNTNIPVARKLGFNDQEIEAIKKAATGTVTGNTARFLGKGAPTGIVSAAGGLGVGHVVGGPVGMVGLPAVGYLAKKIGDLSTRRAASALDSLVRSRSPLAAQVAAQLPPQIVQQLPAKTTRLLRALIVADPTLREQVAQPVPAGGQ